MLAGGDPAGTRLPAPISRGGRTKKATAQLVAHLVRRGYLELHEDPSDGRGKCHVPTLATTGLLTVCARIVVDYEARLTELLGARGIERRRDTLGAIVTTGPNADLTRPI